MSRNIFLLFLIFFNITFAQDVTIFKIYDNFSNEVDYVKLLATALQSDVVLFGEIHNNPISHWFEYNLIKDIYKSKKENLIIGTEIFEVDEQLIIDEYFNDLINEQSFLNEVKLWKNYNTDYKPIVNFAKTNRIQFYATNVPRRYAAIVSRDGFEGLKKISKEAKNFLPPLPIKYDSTQVVYKEIIEMPPHPGSNLLPSNIAKAQALKDAAMAYFILKYWKKGKVMFHFHGAKHSEKFSGIYYYLKQYKKDLKIITITTVEQNDLSSPLPEYAGIADFIICVKADMFKSY